MTEPHNSSSDAPRMPSADAASPDVPYMTPQEIPYAVPTLVQRYASVRRTAQVVVWLSYGQIALMVLLLWPFLESVLYYEVDQFYPPSWELGILGEMTAGDIAGAAIG